VSTASQKRYLLPAVSADHDELDRSIDRNTHTHTGMRINKAMTQTNTSHVPKYCMVTYFLSIICTAWYHPIPRLGAPHPTSTTSAWPLAANRGEVFLKALELTARAVLRAKKAADCCMERAENMIVVNASFICESRGTVCVG
jgi:hypothetical protein